jgi:hypothetical protein
MDGVPLVWTSIDVNATNEVGVFKQLNLNAGWNHESGNEITHFKRVKIGVTSNNISSLTMWEALLLTTVSMLPKTSRSFLLDNA